MHLWGDYSGTATHHWSLHQCLLYSVSTHTSCPVFSEMATLLSWSISFWPVWFSSTPSLLHFRHLYFRLCVHLKVSSVASFIAVYKRNIQNGPLLLDSRRARPLPLTAAPWSHPPTQQPPAEPHSYVSATTVVSVPGVTCQWGIHQLHHMPTGPTSFCLFKNQFCWTDGAFTSCGRPLFLDLCSSSKASSLAAAQSC